MTSVGQLLRAARQSQARGIPEIAEELCLTQRYLRAMEEDDLQHFRGAFFYKSFVRQYAVTLGVDVKTLEPLLAPVTDALFGSGAEAAPYTSRVHNSTGDRATVRTLDPIVEETNQPYFSRLRMRWSVGALAIVLVACSGFYAWWTGGPPAAEPPSSVVQPLPAAVPPSSFDAEAVPLVLTLSATERTWLSISANGRQIFSGFLLPSESKTLSGVEAATLRIGNAAGIEIHWKGKPLGPIGARGEVRTVLLTPRSFEIL